MLLRVLVTLFFCLQMTNCYAESNEIESLNFSHKNYFTNIDDYINLLKIKNIDVYYKNVNEYNLDNGLKRYILQVYEKNLEDDYLSKVYWFVFVDDKNPVTPAYYIECGEKRLYNAVYSYPTIVKIENISGEYNNIDEYIARKLIHAINNDGGEVKEFEPQVLFKRNDIIEQGFRADLDDYIFFRESGSFKEYVIPLYIDKKKMIVKMYEKCIHNPLLSYVCQVNIYWNVSNGGIEFFVSDRKTYDDHIFFPDYSGIVFLPKEFVKGEFGSEIRDLSRFLLIGLRDGKIKFRTNNLGLN